VLDHAVALQFRDDLRSARAAVLKNAEAFEHIVFVLERLGVYLTRRIDSLREYCQSLTGKARRSPLGSDLAPPLSSWHASFDSLYEMVREARNDALHEGAYARHLTAHAVELALILEDALMEKAVQARDFMVRKPVQAHQWQPISSVRREMLENAFSFLPVLLEEAGATSWSFVSDLALARYLRVSGSGERKARLATTLGEAVSCGAVRLKRPEVCQPEDPVTRVLQILEASAGRPVLVIGEAGSHDLRGIVTSYDLL
jgi:CBS domain-containing protein